MSDLIQCENCKKRYLYHPHPVFNRKMERSELADNPKNDRLSFSPGLCGPCRVAVLGLLYFPPIDPGEDL